MTIDIIQYTSEQFALLNSEQINEIKRVQSVKNRLTRRLTENRLKEKYRLSKAGIFRSGIWQKLCEKLQEEYDAEVETLREGLLFYLQYGYQSQGSGYTVDYALSIAERVSLVKDYYLRTYDDPNERFEAFKADKVAPKYLAEAYSSLYHWFELDVVET
jgi:hypothetical protein